MDLKISYATAALAEIAFLDECSFDSETGSQNNFALTVPKRMYNDLKNACVFVWDDFAAGGRITSVLSDSASQVVKFSGVTWAGVLVDHTLTGLTYTNYATSALVRQWLTQTGLADVFEIDTTTDSVTFTVLQGETLLSAIMRLFELTEKTLDFSFDRQNQKIKIVPQNRQTMTQAQYNSIVFPVEIEHALHPYTEVTVKGKNATGYAYLQQDGSIGSTRYYTGIQSRAKYFEDSGSEDAYGSAVEKLKELLVIDNASVKIGNAARNVRVGDIVEAEDETTKIKVTAKVVSKVVKIRNGRKSVEFSTERG